MKTRRKNDWNELFLGKFKGYEKIFPNQYFNNFLFEPTGTESYEQKLFETLEKKSQLPLDIGLFNAAKTHSTEELASSSLSLSFLCFIVKLLSPKIVVEIGSFVGFSTCNIAKCLPPDGKVFSIEKFDYFADIAQKNVTKFGLNEQAVIVKGDAIEVLSTLEFGEKKLDLAFIDGNKEEYLAYLKWSVERLSDKGIIIIDDIFFHGDVLNDVCETEKGEGVKAVIEYLSNDAHLDYSFLPIANGLLFLKKQ